MEGFVFVCVLAFIFVIFPQDINCEGKLTKAKCPKGVEDLAKEKGMMGGWTKMNEQKMDPIVLAMASKSNHYLTQKYIRRSVTANDSLFRASVLVSKFPN